MGELKAVSEPSRRGVVDKIKRKLKEYMGQADKICPHCPEFLMPTVLESMLRPTIETLTRDEHYYLLLAMCSISRNWNKRNTVKPAQQKSFDLALEVLEQTFNLGVEKYFDSKR